MKKRFLKACILAVLLIAAALALHAALATSTVPAGWDVSYPMSNRNIEWTGAGYNGNGR